MESPKVKRAQKARPEDRSSLYYERAKHLSVISSNTSVELERQLREMYKALSYQSEDVKLYLLLGKIYKQNLDLSSALFCYRFALKKDPSNVVAQKVLVQLLILKGKELMLQAMEMDWLSKYHAARSFFDEALEYARDHEEVLTLKAVCHIHCNELTEAFETVNKALQPHKQPKAELFILRAKINWGRGLVEQGNQDIRCAAGLDPKHPEVLAYIERSYAKSEKLYKLSLKLFLREKYKEALEHVNHAIFLTNEDVKLYIIQSKIFRMMKDHQAAYESILKAKAIFDARFDAGNDHDRLLPPEISHQIHLILNEIALDKASRGQYQDAILLYNRIIRESLHASSTTSGVAHALSVDYKYYMNRGDCYRAMQALHEAVADYQEALALEDSDWNINVRLSLTYYLLALDLFNTSQFHEAEAHLSRAIQYNPKVGEYWALRGKARYYSNNYKYAYEDFKQALVLDPDHIEVRARLQQFESQMGIVFTPPAVPTGADGTVSKPGSKPRKGGPPRSPSPRQTALALSSSSNEPLLPVKTVQRVKPGEDDVIHSLLHPQHVQTTSLRYLHDVSAERKQQEKQAKQPLPLVLDIDRSIDNSGHVVKKPLPLLLANTAVMSQIQNHAFRGAILATEQVHEKSVAVVQQYIHRENLARGPMWNIVDTAKKLAHMSNKERSKKLVQQTQPTSAGAGRKRPTIKGGGAGESKRKEGGIE